MVFRSMVMTSVLAVSAIAGAAEDPVDAVQSHIADSCICYEGEWGSEAAYLARPATQKVYEDPVQRERARERYRIWRERYDCRWITYPVDDLQIRGFLVKPTGEPPPEGWPVVIFNHGGNADIGQIRFQYIAARLFPLVDAGFVVMGSQYRGTRIGDTPNPDRLRDEFGGADVDDVRALVSIAESLPYADADRIGMWGMSRGGMMTLVAARGSERFDALVLEATPTDMIRALEERPEMERVFREWVPGFDTDREAVLRERSAIHWMDALDRKMPILIIHGSEDRRVDVGHVRRLAEALEARGHPHELIINDGGGHGPGRFDRETIKRTKDWFLEQLTGAT